MNKNILSLVILNLFGVSSQILAEPRCQAEAPLQIVEKALATNAASEKLEVVKPAFAGVSTNIAPFVYTISPEEQKANDDGLWSHISARSTGRIYRLLALYSKVTTVSGKEINIAEEFGTAMYAAESCDEKVLSLGEGRSTLISGLLHEKETYLKRWAAASALDGRGSNYIGCGLSNIHAVDVAYPDHDAKGNVTDQRKPDMGNAAGLDKYDAAMIPLIKQYPKNYHSQLFQKLDLRDEDGKRMLFTKIISSYSLGYVLNIKEIPEEVRLEMIDRVIDHLAPGGKLIMFPMMFSNDGSFGEKFYNRLAELKTAKVISDYSIYQKNGKELAMVLVR